SSTGSSWAAATRPPPTSSASRPRNFRKTGKKGWLELGTAPGSFAPRGRRTDADEGSALSGQERLQERRRWVGTTVRLARALGPGGRRDNNRRTCARTACPSC